MKDVIRAAAIAATGLLTMGAAHAAVSFDQNLASPSTNPGDPGYYDGTGNPNGAFTVDNENGIELGLRAKNRFDGLVTPTGNTYTVPAGAGTSATLGKWNVDFSIDLNPNGASTTPLDLSQITANLSITKNGTLVATINVLGTTPGNNIVIDDSLWGAGGKTTGAANYGSSTGAQNSENPGFFPDVAFDPNAPGSYEFTLTVDDLTGKPLAADTIGVNVVPEPGTLALFGVGLAGLGLVRRRKA